ncbi:MAG TPA: response regulator [Bdellovibrio sp.]|uniref:response regulator n=1 Tax=Bdellovibrio sp. TaxID=28201 RepID=UPI002EF6CFAE
MAEDKDESVGTRFTTLKTFFVIAAILIVLNSLLLFSSFRNMREQQWWVEHTAKVISEIDLTLSAMKDAETGVRGYLLTRRQDYLEPFTSGIQDVWLHYRNLKGLTLDNPRQVSAMTELEKTLKDREATLKEAINNYQPAKMKAPLPSDGKLVMDRLRQELKEMKDEELRLQEVRTQKAQQTEQLGYISWILSMLVNLGLASAAFFFIRRNWRRQHEENRRQTREAWSQARIAEVAAVMAEDLMIDELSTKILSILSRLLNAPYGSLYVLEDGLLTLRGSYAHGYHGKETRPKKLQVGETLLGEAVKKNELLEITSLPSNYINIESSLGQSAPQSLLLLPLFIWGRAIGVIELAFLKSPSEEEKQFLDRLSEILATGISSAISKEGLQVLLSMTQEQAQELQAQQEELRASNEELEEQARALEIQQESLNSKNRELEVSRRDVEAKALDLEKTNQYKSEFLAKMSHELRTPLNSLLILATLLRENKDGNLTDQQVNFASTIYDAGNDLLGLISDILDISKIEARKLNLRAERFSLGSLISQLQATFLPQTNKKGLSLLIDANDELKALPMHSDLQRIEQILRNFLSNAVKFTEKGSITIAVSLSSKQNGFVVISIKDTGVGISPEKKSVIFNAFEQGDSSISRKYGGTGLGLTISKELAGLLGGHITVESEVGQGSVFTLEVPFELPGGTQEINLDNRQVTIAKVAEERPSIIQDEKLHKILESVKSHPKTLLIVEDDETCRCLVAEASKGYGYFPLEAETGEFALSILEKYIPTAIMLDIKLPGVSGVGLLESIKQKSKLRHVPVHMISGLEYQQNTLRMGAMGYLAKPATLEGVKGALRHIEEIVSKKARSVLVVEDDQIQRESIMRLIAGYDLKIVGAAHGAEAFDFLKKEKFDCVILDLALPDMSGAEFLNKLNEIHDHVPPVIVYTGQDLSREEEAALRKFAESIILKGVRSPERLLDEVNLFLHRVEKDLPDEQKDLLRQLRGREKSFEGRHVLLVDDDIRNLFSLTHVLEGKGFKVVVARDGIEALEKVANMNRIDVILMDIMMPRMDGYEAIRRIRQLPNHTTTPIIALTAKAMKGDHEKCIEMGANDYLPKPINLENLVSVLKVWLEALEAIS